MISWFSHVISQDEFGALRQVLKVIQIERQTDGSVRRMICEWGSFRWRMDGSHEMEVSYGTFMAFFILKS